MTISPRPKSVPQTQDELRDRFVQRELDKHLRKYHCEVTEPFDLSLDPNWNNVIRVRREDYREWETNKRVALIYWTESEEPLISKLIDDGVLYKWDLVTPATKDWSSYGYKPDA